MELCAGAGVPLSEAGAEYAHDGISDGGGWWGLYGFPCKKATEEKPWQMYPAADGYLGCILRVYQEWMLSGDESFLKKLWSQDKLSMTYACSTWYPDGDGVMEAMQHNTYDIEFYGYMSMTNSIFYAALLAAAKMADYFGEVDRQRV